MDTAEEVVLEYIGNIVEQGGNFIEASLLNDKVLPFTVHRISTVIYELVSATTNREICNPALFDEAHNIKYEPVGLPLDLWCRAMIPTKAPKATPEKRPRCLHNL